MDPRYPPLPLFIVTRSVDYDEASDTLIVSPKTPYVAVVTEDLSCFPAFTSRDLANGFLNQSRMQGKVAECSAERLLNILEAIQPPGFTVDPSVSRGRSTSYQTLSVIEWLRTKTIKA